MNTSIVVDDKCSFDIGCRVVLWDEPKGLNFIPHGRFSKKGKCQQFTTHWSVTYRAKHMCDGLVARGLSVNFMIDDDCDKDGYSTVYQCLPLKYFGWSQGKQFNTLGHGVEVSYMPQCWSTPGLYSEYNRKRYNVPLHKTTTAPIHGTKLKVFLPTKAQMNSLIALTWGYTELYPHVPAKFPKKNGEYITTVLPKPETYEGLVNHYHLKRGKVDTAGLDMKKVEDTVAQMQEWGY